MKQWFVFCAVKTGGGYHSVTRVHTTLEEVEKVAQRDGWIYTVERESASPARYVNIYGLKA